MTILVTGGHGFIGKNFIKFSKKKNSEKIINIDNISYAAKEFIKFRFNSIDYKLDINSKNILNILKKYRPRAIINFAAETHVDRSIDNAKKFIYTNISGTLNLLNCAKIYSKNTKRFIFLQVSTDEVFGSLSLKEKPFKETNRYEPLNPYAASKAASDHLVRSFINTYNLPAIITNCSNNFGPFQNSEKLIPKIILNSLSRNNIPIYGKGKNIRDWIYVEDHCSAIHAILKYGKIGESYNIGGKNETTNLELVKKILKIIKKIKKDNFDYQSLIKFVKDRPGHDFRYAINSNKLKKNCKWKISEKFNSQLYKTIKWYVDNENFITRKRSIRKRNL